MDAILQAVSEYLISRGDFAVISGILALSLWRTIQLLIRSLEDRIVERVEAEKRSYEAMVQRAAEYERWADILKTRRRT